MGPYFRRITKIWISGNALHNTFYQLLPDLPTQNCHSRAQKADRRLTVHSDKCMGQMTLDVFGPPPRWLEDDYGRVLWTYDAVIVECRDNLGQDSSFNRNSFHDYPSNVLWETPPCLFTTEVALVFFPTHVEIKDSRRLCRRGDGQARFHLSLRLTHLSNHRLDAAGFDGAVLAMEGSTLTGETPQVNHHHLLWRVHKNPLFVQAVPVFDERPWLLLQWKRPIKGVK